jgi:hypothetical protein
MAAPVRCRISTLAWTFNGSRCRHSTSLATRLSRQSQLPCGFYTSRAAAAAMVGAVSGQPPAVAAAAGHTTARVDALTPGARYV